MSMAAVVVAHGINANLLRHWVREADMKPRSKLMRANVVNGAKAQELKPVMCRSAGRHRHRLLRPRHSHQATAWTDEGHGDLAGGCRQRLRGLDARTALMIRIDAMWLADGLIDMHAGVDCLLERVV
jgi:hypothetical protein